MRNKDREREIREILRTARARAGMTQETLAAALYVDRSTISKIETGEIAPSYTLVKEWARVTKSEDLINLHLTGGVDGARKLTALESLVKDLKDKMASVSFMRRKGAKRHDATASVGPVRGRV